VSRSGIDGGLNHPARRRIYEHLTRLPGDYFRSIVRSLRLGHGAAHYHLDVLVRGGYLLRETTDGRCRYYPKAEGAESERNRLYMKHWKFRDLRLRVLLVLGRLKEAGAVTVARELRISRQLASYHLSQLAKRGEVRHERGRFTARLGH
jgi:predicted transcriptional regulator